MRPYTGTLSILMYLNILSYSRIMAKAINGNTSSKNRRHIAASPIPNFATSVVDFILRQLLTLNLTKMLIFYFAMVAFVSVVCDLQKPVPGYFSNKKNVFNQYFVKLGWGWTLLGICSLLCLTNFVENKGEFKNFQSSVVRVAVMSVLWYICTHSFEWFENVSGHCKFSPGHSTKRACLRAGFSWLGFDVSGHCFLLLFSIIFINQECKALDKISKKLDELERDGSANENPPSLLSLLNCRLYLRIIMIFLAFLMLLWTVMMFFTSVYFHTVVQKLLGLAIATSCWFLVYKVLNLGPR